MTPEWPVVAPSKTAERTSNPIRQAVDARPVKPNPQKTVLSLGLGDPTVFGNMDTHPAVTEAVVRQAQALRSNGYPPASGDEKAKAALAAKYSTLQSPLTPEDVVIASGCSGALDLALSVLASEGDTVLVPRPGFTLYGVLCRSKGIHMHHYALLPERSWEIDLAALDTWLSSGVCRPAAWIINNPSNPCGSVYSAAHLAACVALASRHRIPIVADEIYEDMVFAGHAYQPLRTLAGHVPVLTCSGLSKRYLVPGWRLGWILIHDTAGLLANVRAGLVNLCGLILGANSLIQAALPAILQTTPPAFFQDVNSQLGRNAHTLQEALAGIPGITVVEPQGTLYAMVGIDLGRFRDISDDRSFTELLTAEESVICLPGSIFGMPNYFRIVFSGPQAMITEACGRIRVFCSRHLK